MQASLAASVFSHVCSVCVGGLGEGGTGASSPLFSRTKHLLQTLYRMSSSFHTSNYHLKGSSRGQKGFLFSIPLSLIAPGLLESLNSHCIPISSPH